MEANFDIDDFYKQLVEDERQMCDLCRDWGLGDCGKCGFIKTERRNQMNVVLYTINCPKCIILEKKLQQKKVKFTKVSNVDVIKKKGLGNLTFPILEVEGMIMNYTKAVEWINNI